MERKTYRPRSAQRPALHTSSLTPCTIHVSMTEVKDNILEVVMMGKTLPPPLHACNRMGSKAILG